MNTYKFETLTLNPVVTAPHEKTFHANVSVREKAEQGDLESLPVKMSAVELSVYYGKFRALKDISINIPENNITALIRPGSLTRCDLDG